VAAQVISAKGATTHAPGNAIATIAEAIIRDKKSVIPVSTLLEGEYGAHNLCIGVPAVIGSNGLDKIIELRLNDYEKKIFNKGVLDVKEAIESIGLN
jgi:malate dehydrogenase